MTRKLKYSDITHAFYVPGSISTIDLINPFTDLGMWSNETLEQVRERHPGAVIETLDTIDRNHDENVREAPNRITAERWDYSLNVLPPVRWIRESGAETFHISELVSGSMANILCRVGDVFYEMVDNVTLNHREIIAMCLESDEMTAEEQAISDDLGAMLN